MVGTCKAESGLVGACFQDMFVHGVLGGGGQRARDQSLVIFFPFCFGGLATTVYWVVH